MKVYCYYTPIYSLSETVGEDVERLIDLWKVSWARFGWEPTLLVPEQTPDFNRFNSAISKLPTVNSIIYESACYVRWKAMAQVGGGLMTDYDVINYGFTPVMVCDEATIYNDGRVPCMVSGTTYDFEVMCKVFENYKPTASDLFNGVPHISDMHIVKQGHWFHNAVPVCEEYSNVGWKKARCVHYSHAAIRRCGIMEKQRAKLIPILSAERSVV